jgi:hypothetical protein
MLGINDGQFFILDKIDLRPASSDQYPALRQTKPWITFLGLNYLMGCFVYQF